MRFAYRKWVVKRCLLYWHLCISFLATVSVFHQRTDENFSYEISRWKPFWTSLSWSWSDRYWWFRQTRWISFSHGRFSERICVWPEKITIPYKTWLELSMIPCSGPQRQPSVIPWKKERTHSCPHSSHCKSVFECFDPESKYYLLTKSKCFAAVVPSSKMCCGIFEDVRNQWRCHCRLWFVCTWN